MSINCPEVVNYNICIDCYNYTSEMFKEEINYIKNYIKILNDYINKVSNLNTNSVSKITNPPKDFSNKAWIKIFPILNIAQQIPNIIKEQTEYQKKIIGKLDDTIKTYEVFLESIKIEDFQQKYEKSNNNLIQKYTEVENKKNSFLESMNKTEDIIVNYYYKNV